MTASAIRSAAPPGSVVSTAERSSAAEAAANPRRARPWLATATSSPARASSGRWPRLGQVPGADGAGGGTWEGVGQRLVGCPALSGLGQAPGRRPQQRMPESQGAAVADHHAVLLGLVQSGVGVDAARAATRSSPQRRSGPGWPQAAGPPATPGPRVPPTGSYTACRRPPTGSGSGRGRPRAAAPA